MSREAEVQLTNGEREQGDVFVKANGWVRIQFDDADPVHYPSRKVERIVGEANHQSPNGGI